MHYKNNKLYYMGPYQGSVLTKLSDLRITRLVYQFGFTIIVYQHISNCNTPFNMKPTVCNSNNSRV